MQAASFLLFLLSSPAWANAPDCPPKLALPLEDQPALTAATTAVKDELFGLSTRKFFSSLPPCEAKEFANPSLTGVWGAMMGLVSPQDIEQTAREVVRPGKSNKRYFSHLNRPAFRRNARRYAILLQASGLALVPAQAVRDIARLRYESAKASGEIGECVSIDTMGGLRYVAGTVRESIPLSPSLMKDIDDLFREGSRVRALPLSARERSLIQEGKLRASEIYELRAIRKATEILEQNTFLKNDEAGGFFSNFKGELLGNDQQNCVAETDTLIQFFETLKERKLLRHFHDFRQITRAPSLRDLARDPSQSGHVAVETRAPSSGMVVVIDGWFEPGGSSAHLVSEEEWRGLSLWQKNEFKDLAEPVP